MLKRERKRVVQRWDDREVISSVGRPQRQRSEVNQDRAESPTVTPHGVVPGKPKSIELKEMETWH